MGRNVTVRSEMSKHLLTNKKTIHDQKDMKAILDIIEK